MEGIVIVFKINFIIVKTMNTFTLHRKGEFNLLDTSANQCKAQGHRTYTYEVAITSPEVLDKQGFLIDHENVNGAVLMGVQKANSCEKLCQCIGSNVSAELARLSVPWIRIQVILKPHPAGAAWMEYVQENK